MFRMLIDVFMIMNFYDCLSPVYTTDSEIVTKN